MGKGDTVASSPEAWRDGLGTANSPTPLHFLRTARGYNTTSHQAGHCMTRRAINKAHMWDSHMLTMSQEPPARLTRPAIPRSSASWAAPPAMHACMHACNGAKQPRACSSRSKATTLCYEGVAHCSADQVVTPHASHESTTSCTAVANGLLAACRHRWVRSLPTGTLLVPLAWGDAPWRQPSSASSLEWVLRLSSDHCAAFVYGL